MPLRLRRGGFPTGPDRQTVIGRIVGDPKLHLQTRDIGGLGLPAARRSNILYIVKTDMRTTDLRDRPAEIAQLEITEEMVAAGLDAFTDIAHSEPGTEEIRAGLAAAFMAMLKTSLQQHTSKSALVLTDA